MNKLTSFRNVHKGETIIVCGCGDSLNDFAHPERYITIGVNDVGRYFHPNYLVVVNPRSQFSGDRFRHVETSQAEYLFTQLDLDVPHPNIVKFSLGTRGGTDFSDPNVLHYTQNSPYIALCLAVHMGAKHIGLIGVDFTDNHFFGKTGRHVLTNQLVRIDAEYRALGKALSKHGIEVVNLSKHSRLAAFKKGSIETIEKMNKDSVRPKEKFLASKIFFINYKFLSCDDVFRYGLNHAAEDLKIEFEEAYWNDQKLPDKVRKFNPDLIFVVHGRSFCKRWVKHFQNYNTAVWLLDEPYEVDDTSSFSGNFTKVFVNDPNSIHRHRNAHYLPVGFDPHIYFPTSDPKKYEVGFIGGYNSVRQNLLEKLHRKSLLTYIVGGPWKGNGLKQICLSRKVSPSETAILYKQTKIVLNIFREVHHFNKQKIPAFSLNPRIYEALACGALVVSEDRPELKEVFPGLPVFERGDQLLEIVEELRNDDKKYKAIQRDCYRRLKDHTYLNRLKKVIRISLKEKSHLFVTKQSHICEGRAKDDVKLKRNTISLLNDWENYGNCMVSNEDRDIILRKQPDSKPGTERGLVCKRKYSSVDLSFEVYIKDDSCFIAKIHQRDKYNQLTNSYHLMCEGRRNYFARHNHIFRTFDLNRNIWERIRIVYEKGQISFFRNKYLLFFFKDPLLKEGYAFLGLKGGEALLRNVSIADFKENKIQDIPLGIAGGIDYEILHTYSKENTPIVSIITTVYDRAECLENCIRSVKNLTFKDYEHIIVADCPPKDVLKKLNYIVEKEDIGKIKFLNLKKRYNNWGITPASVGIKLSKGRYICFLSDDNGYTPNHVGTLVEALEKNANIGFVYSSCLYDGRGVLNSSVPYPGRIDLGQPMFRRDLFNLHFNDALPFNMLAWDWHMIDYFIKKGIRWKHINTPTFIFRLQKYPQFNSR